MSDEIADRIASESIDRASLEAARANPELKIRCARCGHSWLGSEFPEHFKQHVIDSWSVPSHWEAL